MSIYGLLVVIFMITAFILTILTIVVVASKKSALYDATKRDLDALDRLVREEQNTQNELREMTDDELRRRALGRW